MGPEDKEQQEEAYEGQRIEAAQGQVEGDAVNANPGKCPTCGRDR
jgi:hypothetical protein